MQYHSRVISPSSPPAWRGSFEPSSVAGMELWVQSDKGWTEDTGIDAMVNQVPGNSWGNLTQGTGTLQPALVSGHFPSGRDASQGDGANDFIGLSATKSLAPPYSMFMVFWLPSLAALRRLENENTNTNMLFVRTDGALEHRVSSSSGLTIAAAGTFSAMTDYYIELYVDALGVHTIYSNDVDVTSGTPTSTNSRVFQDLGSPDSSGDARVGAWGVASDTLLAQRVDFASWLANWSAI